MALPKSACDNCVNTECLWRAPTGGNDPPVMICPNKIDKPKTNYDRIISESPELLAMEICTDFGGVPWCKNIPECQDTLCVECVIKWLKQEVEE